MDWSVAALVWIVGGGVIVGIAVRRLMPGRPRVPAWAAVAAGIIGMLIGDWLAALLSVAAAAGHDGVRRAVQLVVGIVAVMIVAAVFARASTVRTQRAGAELGSMAGREDD